MALTQVQPAMLGTPQPNNFKNRIINGQMQIDQRNAGAAVTLNANNIYTVDRWRSGQLLQTWGSGVVTAQQSTDAPAGFVNSLKLTVATADSSLAATDGYGFIQQIEANNIGDLDWGKVTAKTVTISFWVRSSVVGTYAGSLVSNGSTNYSYVFTYSIPVADTWTYVTATVSGQTVNNTPNTGNGVGISVVFDLGSGSNLNATADTWTSGIKSRTSGSVNWISNAAATFYITGVQLEVGVSATGFDYRPYGTELALCQRYYETSFDYGVAPSNGPNSTSFSNANGLFACIANNGSYPGGYIPFKVTKRALPTMTGYGNNTGQTLYQNPLGTLNWSANALFMSLPGLNGCGITQQVVGNALIIVNGQWVASAEL